jgi:hypothetical protein
MKIPKFFLASLLVGCCSTTFVVSQEVESAATTEESASATDPSESDTDSSETDTFENVADEPVQSGPLIDLLGTQLYSMEIVDETSAQINAHYTNEVLAGKKVIGLYFSADW